MTIFLTFKKLRFNISLYQQRSVVQATSQIAKTEPGTQLSVTSLQPVHITPEVSQTHAFTVHRCGLNVVTTP